MSEKLDAKQLREALCMKNEHAADVLAAEEVATADAFCEGYKAFLNACKTERECTAFFVAEAQKQGYTPFDPKKAYKPGDKFYYNNRGKALILATMGTASLEEGVRINVAHVDSPRLDLKSSPLYEDTDFALLKTHYYGGIKKYQWTAIPLALHGVVVKKDGTTATVTLGEGDKEPKFVITDLLPHLAKEQMKRSLEDGVAGEELNILIGSRPLNCDGDNRVKLHILKLLNEKYGMTEADFQTAEFEMVPALPACDIGLDASMIGAYGHDDRVCAYPAAMAAFAVTAPKNTSITILADKEEIGSEGNTGMRSDFLRFFLQALARTQEADPFLVFENSKCLSADVNAGFDPTYPGVLDKRNCAYLNKGIVVTKYTGSRGKSGSNDASAEFVGEVGHLFDKEGVVWQMGELGKVDEGGGGTVAKYVSCMNIDVVDVGVPVLSMHAPFEVVAKLDVYMALRAFEAFLKA